MRGKVEQDDLQDITKDSDLVVIDMIHVNLGLRFINPSYSSHMICWREFIMIYKEMVFS